MIYTTVRQKQYLYEFLNLLDQEQRSHLISDLTWSNTGKNYQLNKNQKWIFWEFLEQDFYTNVSQV